ncbi:MAG TPA: OsmC family peroxiredoxin [Bauldia sp.]|nr:OsmC family peroxiredoxin [Bauldia sp.]
MPTRTSEAEWQGNLKEGRGHMRLGSGAYEGAYSFNSRFSDGGGTNPEELIAAAQAGCYAMALAADLSAAGFTPKDVRVKAALNLDMASGKPTITEIALTVGAEVPGIDDAAFQKIAENTRKTCPVARALLGTVKLTLDATLKG